MFERYTESARRTLFFARYEVSQLGAASIEAEHLLLGIARETKGLVARILAESRVMADEVRAEVERRSSLHEKISTSVEIPFADSARRALNFAAEEADQMKHGYIGPEHLLLGLLRDKDSLASSILEARGLQLDAVRAQVLRMNAGMSETRAAHSPAVEEIDRLKQLVERLAGTTAGTDERKTLAQQIREGLDGLKRYFGR